MEYYKLMSGCKLVDLTKTIYFRYGRRKFTRMCKNEGISATECEKLLTRNEMNDCLVEIFDKEISEHVSQILIKRY